MRSKGEIEVKLSEDGTTQCASGAMDNTSDNEAEILAVPPC